jgi:hypothetical protein
LSLLKHKFARASKRERNTKALQFHAMCLIVTHFHALKHYVESKAVRDEKREIMSKVIQTVDAEHLKQRTFDAIF